ncbi:cell division protein FtsL [Halopseudomonas salegens]|uniref:Cell division protein FtsL n=1 Tax=Halopseudomonas salegens TaxID=1434072 RepID=A0A1H2GRM9_9GAMM|nr:cell division protein FtsL [Halopseudomonas salegens]SDU22333.1 cell division protein FtsL [Halopseudomonas salegens]
MNAPDQINQASAAAAPRALPRSAGWLLLVWLLVLATGLAVSYSTHWSRVLLNELAAEISQREKSQAEWGRLVLEQSTWTAHARVEALAGQELDMRVPQASDIIMVVP